MNNWYEKSLPKISDIQKQLSQAVEKISKIKHVKNIYVFGSFFENHKNKNTRIKDVDILTKIDVFSEDLLSIDKSMIKSANLDYLEEEGYSKEAIKFSSSYLSITEPIIDHWIISSDDKLLHWGPIADNIIEHNYIKKEAEDYASKNAGLNFKDISIAKTSQRKDWIRSYFEYMQKTTSGMPSGWYVSDEKNITEILKKSIKIK